MNQMPSFDQGSDAKKKKPKGGGAKAKAKVKPSKGKDKDNKIKDKKKRKKASKDKDMDEEETEQQKEQRLKKEEDEQKKKEAKEKNAALKKEQRKGNQACIGIVLVCLTQRFQFHQCICKKQWKPFDDYIDILYNLCTVRVDRVLVIWHICHVVLVLMGFMIHDLDPTATRLWRNLAPWSPKPRAWKTDSIWWRCFFAWAWDKRDGWSDVWRFAVPSAPNRDDFNENHTIYINIHMCLITSFLQCILYHLAHIFHLSVFTMHGFLCFGHGIEPARSRG